MNTLGIVLVVKQKQGSRSIFNFEEFKRSKFGREKSGLAFKARKIIVENKLWSKANTHKNLEDLNLVERKMN